MSRPRPRNRTCLSTRHHRCYRFRPAPTRSASATPSRLLGIGIWRKCTATGPSESTTKPITVQIRSGEATTCTFANVFVPSGSISLAKRTTGATGTANFLISSQSEPPTQFRRAATTTVPGVAAGAKPVAAVDATDHLPLGTYTITEEQPASSAANGWTLTEVECNGVLEPFEEGTIEVKLTHHDPKVHCVYTDAFSAAPPPPPPPPPKPQPPGPQPDYAVGDLFVTKHASPTVVTRGQVASYRITVKNHGPDAAERVELADEPQGGVGVVSARSSQGACTTKLPVVCSLGTIDAGATVTITIRLAVTTAHSSLRNQARRRKLDDGEHACQQLRSSDGEGADDHLRRPRRRQADWAGWAASDELNCSIPHRRMIASVTTPGPRRAPGATPARP